MLTVRRRPPFVVPTIRRPSTTDAEPVITIGAGRKVNVRPGQVQRLTTPGAGECSNVEEGRQPVTPGLLEEPRQPRRRPRRLRLNLHRPWPLRPHHGTRLQQLLTHDRIVEGLAQHRMDRVHRAA